MKKTTIALIYDFDKTLCTKDMQEYSFIPDLGMEPEAFWKEANGLAQNEQMDRILAYMFAMLEKAKEAKKPITCERLMRMGKNIDFFPGVEQWFEEMDVFGKEEGVSIEHYIISSGLKEIIKGSKIAKYFTKIYASEYLYKKGENGTSKEALWPALSVNYTAKTQFLFRINKGVLEVSEDQRLNEVTAEEERPIPFKNMIYFGDGLTDVPCMRLVKSNGGKAIAVYNGEEGIQKAKTLYCQGRVNYFLEANYCKEKELAKITKKIITQMALTNQLLRKEKEQMNGNICKEEGKEG